MQDSPSIKISRTIWISFIRSSNNTKIIITRVMKTLRTLKIMKGPTITTISNPKKVHRFKDKRLINALL